MCGMLAELVLPCSENLKAALLVISSLSVSMSSDDGPTTS